MISSTDTKEHKVQSPIAKCVVLNHASIDAPQQPALLAVQAVISSYFIFIIYSLPSDEQ